MSSTRHNFSSQTKQRPFERSCKVCWTHTSVQKEAKKYLRRKDFKAECVGGYSYAKRHKILDQICSHMPSRTIKKWNLKSIRERALKYKSQRDFKKYEPQAYRASKRMGVFSEIVEHMTKEGNKAKLPIKKLSFFKKCDNVLKMDWSPIVNERTKK